MAGGDKSIKGRHRVIKVHYEELARYANEDVKHETAVRAAFQSLLADAAKGRHWTLVPELASEGRGRARVVPDGTMGDEFLIPRGSRAATTAEGRNRKRAGRKPSVESEPGKDGQDYCRVQRSRSQR